MRLRLCVNPEEKRLTIGFGVKIKQYIKGVYQKN
jgi:hypothetical protein